MAALAGAQGLGGGVHSHAMKAAIGACHDLLVKLGRYAEACEELRRALAMTNNVREQDLLSKKLNQVMFVDRVKTSWAVCRIRVRPIVD